MDEIATRKSWKIEPITDPKRISISLQFTKNQFSKIQKGLIPHEMEEKWFMFFEDDWLYFHRSWTGKGIFKAKVIALQNGYEIREFWAERNPLIYKITDDDSDRETFCFLIAGGLLRTGVQDIYFKNNMKSEADFIKGWSNLGSLLIDPKNVDHSIYSQLLKEKIKSVLFGVAIGDAVGVPVEFKTRSMLNSNPVIDMIGYGTYNLPPGTFSDDSSLTFCLAEAITQGFDVNIIALNFIKWRDQNYWTARGKVFDVGNATHSAIDRLVNGIDPELAGGTEVYSNGNGSLMRILPLVFYMLDKNNMERFEITKTVSSITHRHIRSVIACYYYLEFARQLLDGKDKFEIYFDLKREILEILSRLGILSFEIDHFNRLLAGNIQELPEEQIFSSGYVVHSLEASIWCFLTTETYKEAILKAVNLGEDTDTTAAITGGLAGLLYGFEGIPKKWIKLLARKRDIFDLAERLSKKLDNV